MVMDREVFNRVVMDDDKGGGKNKCAIERHLERDRDLPHSIALLHARAHHGARSLSPQARRLDAREGGGTAACSPSEGVRDDVGDHAAAADAFEGIGRLSGGRGCVPLLHRGTQPPQ